MCCYRGVTGGAGGRARQGQRLPWLAVPLWPACRREVTVTRIAGACEGSEAGRRAIPGSTQWSGRPRRAHAQALASRFRIDAGLAAACLQPAAKTFGPPPEAAFPLQEQGSVPGTLHGVQCEMRRTPTSRTAIAISQGAHVYVLFKGCADLRWLPWFSPWSAPAGDVTLVNGTALDACLGVEHLSHVDKVSLAHWAMLEDARLRAVPRILVLEADARFDTAEWSNATVAALRAHLQLAPWHTVRLGYNVGRKQMGPGARECPRGCACRLGPTLHWCSLAGGSCRLHSTGAYLLADRVYSRMQARILAGKPGDGNGCGGGELFCAVDWCPIMELDQILILPPLSYQDPDGPSPQWARQPGSFQDRQFWAACVLASDAAEPVGVPEQVCGTSGADVGAGHELLAGALGVASCLDALTAEAHGRECGAPSGAGAGATELKEGSSVAAVERPLA